MAEREEWLSYLQQSPSPMATPESAAAARRVLRRRSWACPVPLERAAGSGEAGEGAWRGGGEGEGEAARRDEGEGEGEGARAWADPRADAGGYFAAAAAMDDELEEIHKRSHAPASHGHVHGMRLASRARRVSCDTYDYDELEAARMRIKQAAWEVVDAQQKVDIVKIKPTRQQETVKKKGLFKKWLTAPLTWRPVAASRG